MNIKRLPAKEFNFYLSRARNLDKSAVEFLYPYCTTIIKVYVLNKYGVSNFYDNIPHDVFTKIVFENKQKDYPNVYITNPTAYLCRVARNHMINIYNLKDNQTLELIDNYEYMPEYENTLEFTEEAAEKAWYMLDKHSRDILYLAEILYYPLKEVAEILSISYDGVKSKKWRAKADFKKYLKQIKKEVNS